MQKILNARNFVSDFNAFSKIKQHMCKYKEYNSNIIFFIINIVYDFPHLEKPI